MKHPSLEKMRVVALLTVLALCLSLFTGCGDDAQVLNLDEPIPLGDSSAERVPINHEPVVMTAEDPADGTFTLPYNSSYSWNPFKCNSMENRAILQLMYEGLFTMTPDYSAVPVLCESYEVSEVGLTYTLHLRDATFSNGQTLTADDVVFSLNRAASVDFYSARFRSINSYKAIDSKTVEIYLKYANDRLLSLLDIPIVPNNTTAGTYCGTGPFIRTSGTTLTRNENWWNDASSIAFSTVNLYNSSSAEATRDAFEVNEVQLVYTDPISRTAATYHCDYELWISGGTAFQFLAFNQNDNYFSDEALRQAVLRAVDRDTIADQIYHNYADAAVLPVSPRTDMYDESLALNYTYDMNTAKEILKTSTTFDQTVAAPIIAAAEAAALPNAKKQEDGSTDENGDSDATAEDGGEPQETATTEPQYDEDGNLIEAPAGPNSFVFIVCDGNDYRVASAKLIAESLALLGFDVDLQILDENGFFHAISANTWDLMLAEYTLTPDFDLYNIVMPGGTRNYGNIVYDEDLYDLYYDAAENVGNRYDFYECILDHAYICPILFENYAVNATRGVFSGLNPAPGNIFYGLENVTNN